jgi:type IV pilus assembly protein PilM
MAKGKLALGLDIGSSSVKLIHLKDAKKGFTLEAFGVAPLPPEAIVDGALMNSAAIVDAIRELVGSQKLKQKECAIGVSGHSVIIKKISMPRMSQEELEESIQWEAEQYIPFDVKDVNIDVQILNPEADAAGQMDVLLVAAKKDMINDYTSVVAEAGLSPSVVDVDAFACQNAFEVNYELPSGETVVLVNAGASVININVLAKGITTFSRDISMGGNQFTEEIQKQLNVSYDEAEKLKIGGEGAADQDSVIPQEVERVIQGVADQMAGEIQRSLDFYAATAADSHIAKVYLSGGTAKIPALFKVIEQRVGVPVEIMNPFKSIDWDNRKFDSHYLMEVAPSAAVAVGLALRKAGDK